ncbi:hypothetical protein [Scytonema sp. NUACC26]|uniref:hypothetical protein n=1 Tax=Scytonema sp. NUACC26 TaxID=3140176 RepID=UPI0034DB936C
MKLTLKSILFLSVITLVTSLTTHEVKAQSTKCFNVSSRDGWQYFDLGGPYTRVARVIGGWSVDGRNYLPVGPKGHSEPGLEPYNQYKYDQNFPFGALFVDIPTDGHGYIWVQGSQQLPKPITRTSIRINDSDVALGDNSGVLKVCFSR